MKLMQGDCLERMAEIEDGSVDMVITSPPYDNLRDYGKEFKGWGPHIWKPCLDHIKRVLKEGGVCVWIVNDATINGSETGTSFRQALYAMEIGLRLHDTMIWDKKGSQYPSFTRYTSVFEYMFVFSLGKPKTINLFRDVVNKSAGKIVHGNNRNPDGSMSPASCAGNLIPHFGYRTNVWRVFAELGKIRKDHPATFPVHLITDHIKTWSNEGDLVLDPFMGSGTTGVACKRTGREFIGIEQDPTYFKLAEERIKATARQLELF